MIHMHHFVKSDSWSHLFFVQNLICAKHGVQKISGITVFDTIEKKTHEPMADVEVSLIVNVLSIKYLCTLSI